MRVRNAWGAIGAILGLIALYLILVHGTNFTKILKALFDGGGGFVTKLQGR